MSWHWLLNAAFYNVSCENMRDMIPSVQQGRAYIAHNAFLILTQALSENILCIKKSIIFLENLKLKYYLPFYVSLLQKHEAL